MTGPVVQHVDRLDLTFTPQPWAFADARRAEIDAYFAALKREKPALWNGRVLLLHRHALCDGVFRGDYLETDFASFTAWRHWGSPEAGVNDCFAAAAIVAADNAVLLGRMGAHTANAGRIYFPAGTPDPGDIVGGKVDLDFSVGRELKEETGLDIADFEPASGWSMVMDRRHIPFVKTLRSPLAAEKLRERILAHLAREAQPELDDIRVVRGPADFDAAAMPDFVMAYLAHLFAGGLASTPASA
ncbi:MAG: NUDIX hydrolase [Pseudolabrys sp.]